ncbi:hypothetical protein AAHE18_02G206500 [Arachis hypogaea]
MLILLTLLIDVLLVHKSPQSNQTNSSNQNPTRYHIFVLNMVPFMMETLIGYFPCIIFSCVIEWQHLRPW